MIILDIFTKEKRHEVMSKIKGKDTKLEVKTRLWLYHHGIRYRKNNRKIKGSPDIAIAKYKIAIFINGCFWHNHEGCKYSRIPKSNIEFWTAKIERNKNRDNAIITSLEDLNWNVFVVWECQLKKDNFEETMQDLLSRIKECQRKR